MKYLLTVLALAACAATLAKKSDSPLIFGPPKTMAAKMTASLVSRVAAADTLVMVASWTPGADDGKGALDSMRVQFAGLIDSSVVYRTLPFPLSRSMRAPIPASKYVGSGSLTYAVYAAVTVYRRGTNSVPLLSNSVNIVLLDAAPPAPTGLTLQASKVP